MAGVERRIAYRGRIAEEIEQRLADHAALLRRWLTALQARAAARG
jgi:hypothetical protein